jgi:hypothetical protein
MANSSKRYVIVAPYVLARTMTADGPRVLGLHRGAPVPPDVSQEWIDGHLHTHMIVAVDDPATAGAADVTPIEAQEATSVGVNPNVIAAARVTAPQRPRAQPVSAELTEKGAGTDKAGVTPVATPRGASSTGTAKK